MTRDIQGEQSVGPLSGSKDTAFDCLRFEQASLVNGCGYLRCFRISAASCSAFLRAGRV